MAARGNPDTATPDAEQRTTFRRRSRPDPACDNCQGRGCIGCVFREYDHTCEDDCPTCCAGRGLVGVHRPYVFKAPYTGRWVVVWQGHEFPYRSWRSAVSVAVAQTRSNA